MIELACGNSPARVQASVRRVIPARKSPRANWTVDFGPAHSLGRRCGRGDGAALRRGHSRHVFGSPMFDKRNMGLAPLATARADKDVRAYLWFHERKLNWWHRYPPHYYNGGGLGSLAVRDLGNPAVAFNRGEEPRAEAVPDSIGRLGDPRISLPPFWDLG